MSRDQDFRDPDFQPACMSLLDVYDACHKPNPPNFAVLAARHACARCPVSEDCYTEAIERGERSGIWGGVMFTEKAS